MPSRSLSESCVIVIPARLRPQGALRRGSLRLTSLERRLVGRLGFEPRTNGLKGHCSTIELSTRLQQNSPKKRVEEESQEWKLYP